jgi:hypothetical protein
MAAAGIRKRVSARTGRVSYQVWWLLDDGSQGAKTVATKDEARALVAEKRLQFTHATWQGRRRGRLPFRTWADEWWANWSADPHRSPNTLVMADSRLRNHVRPSFGDRPIEKIGPAEVRRWQAQLAATAGHATLAQCRSLVLRIFQFAMDEGAIEANPVRKVPLPKRRADPDTVFGESKRRALTPEEAGRLLQDPTTQTVRLTGSGTGRGARVTVFASSRQDRGALIVEGLGAPPAGRVYELWGIPNGKGLDQAMPATVFRTGGEGVAPFLFELPIQPSMTYGVTEEPGPGGSRKPTRPPILVGSSTTRA